MMKKITIVAQLDKAQPQLKGVANDPKFIILHPEPECLNPTRFSRCIEAQSFRLEASRNLVLEP